MMPSLNVLSIHAFVAFLAFTIVNCIIAKRFGSFREPIVNDDDPSEESQREELGKTWVVLVAGSRGWYNYRHQSDVCHAYHVVRTHGIPKENIITMMYDDIAHNKANPYPGKIYNLPGGEDVYAGVEIDYSGIHVTPENFLAVLGGNKTAVKGGNGRVVESTHYDRIFAYFSDHGGVGALTFPDSVLTVKDLNDALKRMYKLKKFEKLVFYVEACESGSMFAKVLPKNIDVYAVTAANAHESSWGCFCDTELPCLADCFSVNWIVDSEQEDLNRETLARQFEIIKKETNLSHVMHYGDMKIAQDYVAYYLGNKPTYIKSLDAYSDKKEGKPSVAWPSREIQLRMLKKQLHDETQSDSERKILLHKIKKLEMKRKYFEAFMKSLVWSVTSHKLQHQIMHTAPSAVTALDCFDNVIKSFHRTCFHFGRNPYALKYTYVFANLCNAGIDAETIIRKMLHKCVDIEIQGIH